ncbi:hypothetical protein [Enterococcus wangshanyuanii]|uniref:Uncharacterized protein n=1 Tax=Enterococcus wangshanyuanii TaxID=2005703 RepID=A0ABQ1PWX8_9ENTE|nr:hypothetical protein [Enterococcus wangshanyuanii]GGD06201.1 hypothetical protein GCM10011573_39520 [Enterococcus wangshanyuanii]
MTRKRYNFPIDRCPYCGGKSFYISSKASGTTSFFVNSDGTESENDSMYDGLNLTQNKYWQCGDCYKRVFKDSEVEQL